MYEKYVPLGQTFFKNGQTKVIKIVQIFLEI